MGVKTSVVSLRVAVLLCWLCALFGATQAYGHDVGIPRLRDHACHAITAIGTAAPPSDAFVCDRRPRDFQHRRLWMQADLTGMQPAARSFTLYVQRTRFDRMIVQFGYADGFVHSESVVRGDYGTHWRVGGQIAFNALGRDAPIRWVRIGFDRLESYDLVRARLVPSRLAGQQGGIVAALVGGAIALLGLATLYNFLLAIATRRAFVAWQAGWAGCVLAWGLVWSQLALMIAPGIAGSVSARIASILATCAIACATLCAVTGIAGHLPNWLRHVLRALAFAIMLCGGLAAFGGPVLLPFVWTAVNIASVADVILVVLAIGIGWYRGSREARDFALAWTPSMVVLVGTSMFDLGTDLLGGGSYLAVLLTAALQTVWLSIAITFGTARIRIERDAARAEQHHLRDLAYRDPLTAILNRRGFAGAMDRLLLQGAARGSDVGLILIDVDHFKSINDRFGHDVGDLVLERLAAHLEAAAGPHRPAGRMGGEEFAVAVGDLSDAALHLAAEDLRLRTEALDWSEMLGDRTVTVSIGVAQGGGDASFGSLYRAADRALYAAKAAGRNRVAIAEGAAASLRPFRRDAA